MAAIYSELVNGHVPEMFLAGALDLDGDGLWVPQAPDVWFRPLILNVTEGYYVNLLRVRRAGILSRHRHLGPVHAVTLRGTWRYLEHDWTADAGDYVFEPPGEIHTLVVPEACSEMITLFHVTAGYVYLDTDDHITGVEDVFTKIAAVRAHLKATGMSDECLAKLLR